MSPEEAQAEKAALKLIARAEQCTSGLARKLERRGYEESSISAVISRLCKQNLLNDQRFAQFWINSRLRLTRSPRRLLVSLCGRGIDRDDVEAALKAALNEETELALLKRFVEKHSRKAARDGETSRSLKYLLKNEGFSLSVIELYFDDDNR